MSSIASYVSSLVSRPKDKGTLDHDGRSTETSPASTAKVNPLSYPQSSEPFSPDLFKNPTSEYRGAPFWAWNTKLDKAALLRQIDVFQEMGLGGFHMHARVGLDTEYLGEEFLDLIKACVDYAETKGMLACLYDEDRWPSGSVGGSLTRKYPEYRGRHILWTPNNRGPDNERLHLLGRYEIDLDERGCLRSHRMLAHGEKGTNVWYAYNEVNGDSPWFNDQCYVDSLSPAAMSRFIEMTHEVYKAKVGDKFGSVVPCIFTDEPQTVIKNRLPDPGSRGDVVFPWTNDLPDTFKATYGKDANLIKDLPQLFWNLPGGQPSVTRYRYHDHACERFVSAFLDQLGAWCGRNNIMLDGHMMEEPTLWSQTTALGEAMRCYRSMQMPGIDLLSDWTEYNTAKQASSVARQKGVRGTMSELYGCTHWDFTFEGHKGCGDWQAALGITFRVHHLAWVSMAGEGKRDYPASINYQSPWCREYGYVEDHFARVGVCLTRGRAVTHVAVIHPIESYWLAFGPGGGDDEMGRRDAAFGDLTWWLLHGLVDFDFVSERLLPDQFGGVDGGRLQVGACSYAVVIVPNLRTIRASTLVILRKFADAGGKVIIAGDGPAFIDAQGPAAGAEAPVMNFGTSVRWDRSTILDAVEPYREVRVLVSRSRNEGYYPTDKLLYQMRQDGNERFVFLCNRDRNSPISEPNGLRPLMFFKGQWNVEVLDTLTGEQRSIKNPAIDRDVTFFHYDLAGCESVLFKLSPIEPGSLLLTSPPLANLPLIHQQNEISIELDGVRFSEPNVLMLDWARYKIGKGPWNGPQEILQIDNDIRDHYRLPRKGSAWKQPWATTGAERAPVGHITLEFEFHCETTVNFPTQLALEMQPGCQIRLNGIYSDKWEKPEDEDDDKDKDTKSWWVDEAITTLTVPPGIIRKGTNTLHLDLPFGILTNLERVYLLGPFKVNVEGRSVRLQSWNRGTTRDGLALEWGDIVPQRFPFYVGNVAYTISFCLPEGKRRVVLSVPEFSSPVLKVEKVIGKGKGKDKDKKETEKVGNIAFQPRQLDLGVLEEGRHEFVVTAFGNRYNSFGHLHLSPGVGGCWPDIWRSQGWAWSDDYQFHPIGILRKPTMLVSEVEVEEEGVEDTMEGWVTVQTK